jgi:hypothetical protein
MARDGGLPPASSGMDRGSPGMSESAGAQNLLRQLASRGQGGQGGGGGEQQAAEMVMQGAQMLMQAAQLHPALLPAVQRAIDAIKSGVQGLGGGGEGGPPPPPRERPKRAKKSRRDEEGDVSAYSGSEGGGGAMY